MLTPMEASTIARVLVAIQVQIEYASYEGRREDARHMSRICGVVLAQAFIIPQSKSGEGYFDSPLADPLYIKNAYTEAA